MFLDNLWLPYKIAIMAYRTMYRGREVTCDTRADLDALFDDDATGCGSERKLPEKRRSRTPKAWAKATVDSQRRMLELLVRHHPLSVSDDDIRKELGLENNRKIAGLMGSLTKWARKSGLRIEELIVRESKRNGTGERHYLYGIVPTAIEDVREGLGIKD